jgi:hypothetical protein
MFGMQTLDVAIGMVFIYLILALTCTAINEVIAGWLDRRSKNLVMGIRNLLQDPEERNNKSGKDAPDSLFSKFYSHPLIKSLEEKGARPSYIPSRTFALTFLAIIDSDNAGGPRTIADIRTAVDRLPNDYVKKSLLVLIDEAEGDFKKVQENIEIWFNNAMDRVSGWYKKRTQTIVLFIAIGLVAFLNADTIRISKALANNSALREAVVAQAQEYAKANQTAGNTTDTPQNRIQENVDKLQQLGVPIGYEGEGWPKGLVGWLSKIFGLLLTVGAASLGAPFWFDVLNKFINVRAAGKSPDEMAKSPEAPPKRKEEVPPK